MVFLMNWEKLPHFLKNHFLKYFQQTLRDLKQAVQQLIMYYDISIDENDDIRAVRRAVKNKKKMGNFQQNFFNLKTMQWFFPI